MKKLLMLLSITVMAGCATGPQLDMNKVAEKFYSQPRAYETVKVTGVSELSLKGANISLVLQNELQALSIVPKDTGTAGIIANAVKDTVLVGAGIVTAGNVMGKLANQPQVISQQVVRPEIITVPGN